MPVRYDIAAQIPQYGGGDTMNMLAQMQSMGYRQQQNALAELQMRKLSQELQAQQAIRGMAGGLNMSDPNVVNRIWAQDPEFARQIYGSQLAGRREQATETAQLAAAAEARRRGDIAQQEYENVKLPGARLQEEETRARMGLAQREFEQLKMPKAQLETEKLGLEKQKLGAEITREERAGKKLEFEINKEALDRDAKTLEKLENFGAKVFNNNGKGYDEFRKMAVKEHPEFENMLGAQYDPEALAGFVNNAASTREQLKSASDYEYREVTDATGATRVVAIPKKSPQAGAINVPGATGMKPKDYGFMAGPPDTGLVTRTDPRTGQAELITPSQPIMTPPEGKMGARIETGAPAAPGALIPSEIRPTTEAPVGSAAYNNKRFATEALDAVGFNAGTGEDTISNLIKKSTSGGLQAGAAGVRGFFGGATPGMEAIGQIKAIANDIILKKMNGKLGAGISNEDREFIKSTIGNLDDPSIPANQRLASWNSAKQILMKYANTGRPAASAPNDRPSLNEIFK